MLIHLSYTHGQQEVMSLDKDVVTFVYTRKDDKPWRVIMEAMKGTRMHQKHVTFRISN
jgi:hypothetical protein